MSQQDQRRFKRYTVTDLGIEGMLDARKTESLFILGPGGCGFVGPHENKLEIGRLVICTFEWPNILKRTLHVPGKIVYAKDFVRADMPSKILYGIEFSEEKRENIQPAVERLEHLERIGQIKAA